MAPLVSGTRPTIIGTITLATVSTARGSTSPHHRRRRDRQRGHGPHVTSGSHDHRRGRDLTTGRHYQFFTSVRTRRREGSPETTTGSFTVRAMPVAPTRYWRTIQNTTAPASRDQQQTFVDQMSIQTLWQASMDIGPYFSFTNGTVNNAVNGGRKPSLSTAREPPWQHIAGTLTSQAAPSPIPSIAGLDVHRQLDGLNATSRKKRWSPGLHRYQTSSGLTILTASTASDSTKTMLGSAPTHQCSISGSNAPPRGDGCTPCSARSIILIPTIVSLDPGSTG